VWGETYTVIADVVSLAGELTKNRNRNSNVVIAMSPVCRRDRSKKRITAVICGPLQSL